MKKEVTKKTKNIPFFNDFRKTNRISNIYENINKSTNIKNKNN